MKIETYCPIFPGFYSTFLEPNEENEIDNHNQENDTDLSYDDFEFDYEDYRNRVAKAFTNSFESNLSDIISADVKFQSIASPQYYNFSNDTINIEVDMDFDRFMEIINENKEELREYIRENYTSYDGFTSWHSNDIEDWCNPEYVLEEKQHRVGALMGALVLANIDADDVYNWAEEEMFYINFSIKNHE